MFQDESAAIQTAVGSFFPILLLSGILWPIEGIPSVLREISSYLPCTLATQAMRHIMSRGWNVYYPSVYYGIVSSLSWTLVFLLSAWLVLKYKKL